MKVLTRKIDKVLFGNLEFATWYYSPYPDSIILREDHTTKAATNGTLGGHHTKSTGVDLNEHACPRLCVCPYCFRYTPDVNSYIGHLQHHAAPTEEGSEFHAVPRSATKVYEWEGYAVWDVDGEIEKLYCQNLSLFGKLFLEQKSVFFDTASFHYYVLTYKSPELKPSSGHGRNRRRRGSSDATEELQFKTQVMGFFSKENLSWDSNNLACILVFPPFQHRQLGQLLMAVSYKLSAWEWTTGVIGGPEKPLSAMGRRSYLRFWSERIARFMMGQSADADGRLLFDKTLKKKVNHSKQEMTIREIGDATGMLAEDVVAALSEMDVCDSFQTKRKKQKSTDSNGTNSTRALSVEYEDEQLVTKTILRSKVLDWVVKNRVDLMSPVKEEGFLGEWALSESDDGNQDDQDDQDVASTGAA